jgi:transcriptional regulator with XRE-family HTH domain
LAGPGSNRRQKRVTPHDGCGLGRAWYGGRVEAARHRRGYYRLSAVGYQQWQIAELTGQTQADVSEIIHGREVISYDLLARIAEGLGIARGRLGLAYDVTTREIIRGSVATTSDREVDEDMKRRAAIAAATKAVFGYALLGEAVALDHVPEVAALPSVIGRSDVTRLRALTERLRALGRAGHGVPEVLSRVTARAERWLDIRPATELVGRQLHSAVADLHTLAGWWCTDMLQVDQARWHYWRAVEVAGDGKDAFGAVSAVVHAGHQEREAGDPSEALKLYQLAYHKLLDPALRGDERSSKYQGLLLIRSAHARALMGQPAQDVHEMLARADDQPPFADPFERAAELDVRARTELALGDLDTAQRTATTSIDTRPAAAEPYTINARITRVTAHVLAGERTAAETAAKVLDVVAEQRSLLRVRAALTPLAKALAARRDSTSVELAQRARQLMLVSGS